MLRCCNIYHTSMQHMAFRRRQMVLLVRLWEHSISWTRNKASNLTFPALFLFLLSLYVCHSSTLKPVRSFPSVINFHRAKERAFPRLIFVWWYTATSASSRPSRGWEYTKPTRFSSLFSLCLPSERTVLARFVFPDLVVYPTPRIYTTEPQVDFWYKRKGVKGRLRENNTRGLLPFYNNTRLFLVATIILVKLVLFMTPHQNGHFSSYYAHTYSLWEGFESDGHGVSVARSSRRHCHHEKGLLLRNDYP